MKYFIDCEFVEDGKTIDLISIGLVAEDGREYYAVSTDYDLLKARKHPFVSERVLPHIYQDEAHPDRFKTRAQIAHAIVEFCSQGDEPEFWADYASYDWVALCQLYGTMLDLPAGWPMFCRDIQCSRDYFAEADFRNIINPKPHHALYDARECRDKFAVLLSFNIRQVSRHQV